MSYLTYDRNGLTRWLALPTALLLGCLSACHHAHGANAFDGGADDAATESDGGIGGHADAGAFHVATHAAMPQVPLHDGGVILAHPAITIATMAGDPNTDAAIAFGQWVATSNWLSTVGADYGVHDGTYVGHATVTAPTAAPLTYDDYARWVTSLLTSGALSPPTSPDALYVIFTPEGFGGDTTCMYGTGFHNETTFEGAPIAYAIVFNCTSPTQPYPFPYIEETASHEVIEAATDPRPTTHPGWVFNDPMSPQYIIGEVGDLCGAEEMTIDGHLVQRAYSNTAAARDGDPCVPEDPSTGPYFSVDLSPKTTQLATPGSTVHYTLTGWSSAPTSDWNIYLQPDTNDANANAVLSSMTMNNGGTATLDVIVPSTAQAGSTYFAWIQTYRGMTQKGQAPLMVIVQ